MKVNRFIIKDCFLNFLRNPLIGRGGRLLLLCLVVIAIWLTIEDRWGRQFLLPTRYHSAHYILAMMKLAQQGELTLFTHITTESLGAPFVGQINDFPQIERAIVWSGGQIARLVGLMPAANIMMILSCLVAALSFYFAARLWRIPRLVAWIFSVTYAFLPHNFRSISLLGSVFTGLLPLQFYVLWYITVAQRISWKSHRFQIALFVSLLTGLLNFYWIFIYIHLYLLAFLCRVMKSRKSLINAIFPLGLTCVIAGLFLGSFILFKVTNGVNEFALIRSYSDVERLALKPIELFLPGRATALPFLSKYLWRYYSDYIVIGEHPFNSYIGLCSSLGLFILLFEGTRRQVKKGAPSLPYMAAIWLIAYFSIGGIHSIFSLIFDFYGIRATNRYSTAISTLGFIYFVFVLYRKTMSMNFLFRISVLSILAIFGLIDQSWTSYARSHYKVPSEEMSKRITEDRMLVLHLENTLRPNSMIYILPAIDFPEPYWGRGAFKGSFNHYEPMRPFLHSTMLRYSYGSDKGRQGADWQLDVQELPAGEMAAKLESYGFAGILLNRKGYEDRGERLLAEFAEAGWPMEFEQGVDNEWVFIRLTPAENPVLPTDTPYALTKQK